MFLLRASLSEASGIAPEFSVTRAQCRAKTMILINIMSIFKIKSSTNETAM